MRIWPFGKKTETKSITRKEPVIGRRMYSGAMMGRLTSDWVAGGTSADSEIIGSIRALRNRTRQMVRDNDYARNAIRTIKNNVVGLGISMQSQVKMQRGGKLNKAKNDEIEAAWERWHKAKFCHTGGTLSWSELQQMAIASVAESGEVLIRKIYAPFGGSRVPLALEIIEADQLIENYSGQTAGGNQIRMGVEVDQWQRPVAYWLYPHHPGDYMFQAVQPSHYIRVPANEIIHLYIPDRPGATRGIPWFHTALKRLHNMHGFEEAEIIAARASAALMGFIETPDGEFEDDQQDDDGSGNHVSDFEPGKIQALAPGEKFTGFTPTRPGGVFDPFMRAMIRAVSAGIGTSYESLSHDYSQSNYSSSRLALLNERDEWKRLQKWLIQRLHQEVYDTWLQQAFLGGVISLPGYATQPEIFENVKWRPRGWAWIDPEKEVMANLKAVRAGFRTMRDVVEEQGHDFDEFLLQRQEEIQKAKELGIVFDTDPSQVNDKGLVQPILPTDSEDAEAGGTDSADAIAPGGASDNKT